MYQESRWNLKCWPVIIKHNFVSIFLYITFIVRACWLVEKRVSITVQKHGNFPAEIDKQSNWLLIVYYKRNRKHFSLCFHTVIKTLVGVSYLLNRKHFGSMKGILSQPNKIAPRPSDSILVIVLKYHQDWRIQSVMFAPSQNFVQIMLLTSSLFNMPLVTIRKGKRSFIEKGTGP